VKRIHLNKNTQPIPTRAQNKEEKKMIIQHNIPAMNSHRQLGINNSNTSRNLEKLSSGFRINRAGDDAAGLAISEKMRGQIRGLAMATQNAQNGISLIQTAEGGLNETHAILQRMRELAVQSANGTYKDEVDRENIAKEVFSLKSEMDRIASSTHYNGIKLLDGSLGGFGIDKLGDGKTFTDESVIGSTTGVKTIAAAMGALGATGIGYNSGMSDQGDRAVNVLKEDLANGAEATITTKIFDGQTIVSVQIGDKSYTTAAAGTTAGKNVFGHDMNVLYNADGISVGTLTGTSAAGVGATGAGVLSGVKVTSTGAFDTAGLFDGGRLATDSSKLIFQIGANGSADQRVGLNVANMSSGALGSK
jgi:flagellin